MSIEKNQLFFKRYHFIVNLVIYLHKVSLKLIVLSVEFEARTD
jgi:hypothetical protein